MTAVLTRLSTDQRVLLRGVSWETYEALLRDLEGSNTRLTYDQGLLEIMSPSQQHGRIGSLSARLVETFTYELQIPLIGLRNATWKRATLAKGAEADECYYIAAHAQWAAAREEIDIEVDPPPDLAVE